VQTLTRWLHARDPRAWWRWTCGETIRPCMPGRSTTAWDAIAETDYTGWYDKPTTTPGAAAGDDELAACGHGPDVRRKVLIISEFGAESNTLNPAGSPGSYGFQSRLLANHIAVYEGNRQLSGMLHDGNLRDYPLTPPSREARSTRGLPKLRLIEGLNQKGLFTYGGSAKPAVGVVARLFNAPAAGLSDRPSGPPRGRRGARGGGRPASRPGFPGRILRRSIVSS